MCVFYKAGFVTQSGYACYNRACSWQINVENKDYGYYSFKNGNCSYCTDRCNANSTCEAVSCGKSLCTWWKNGKCVDLNQLSAASSDDTPQTCIKNKPSICK